MWYSGQLLVIASSCATPKPTPLIRLDFYLFTLLTVTASSSLITVLETLLSFPLTPQPQKIINMIDIAAKTIFTTLPS